jgi:hypothetical protein
LLDRWLATLVKLELIRISPFVILTFCSSEFVEFLIGYSPPLAILGPFNITHFLIMHVMCFVPIFVNDFYDLALHASDMIFVYFC